ncbi:cytosol aminopeptidase-like [Ornithodoros turicata]|uniref:cytosol aminopeptidase-like n=1 Tax=Ornithodoros turicata TaxID=34597 RepID=UPI003139EF0B
MEVVFRWCLSRTHGFHTCGRCFAKEPFSASCESMLNTLTRLASNSHTRKNITTTLSKYSSKEGLVLGVYREKDSRLVLTPAAKEYVSRNKLDAAMELFKMSWKKGETRSFYGLDSAKYPLMCFVNLGPRHPVENPLEERDEHAENIRDAISAAVRRLRTVGASSIDIDPCNNAEAAAEGSHLALWSYDELKRNREPPVKLNLLDCTQETQWLRGVIKSQGQNLARRLCETPGNLMTPTIFARTATETLQGLGVQVITRDKKWIKEKKMGSFLSVSQGSEEPPIFLELQYNGHLHGEPTVFVGKGVTFDSGGISIKPSANMDLMRGDMGGAASVVGAFFAIASLKIPIHLVGLIPLTENMPSGRATKPGDVVTAINGTTIQVDNTDAEGRLILADALCYSATFKPSVVVDVATLTGSMNVALGSGAAGTFCTSDILWNLLYRAGKMSGDRLWRMPLFEHYKKQVTKAHLADLSNVGKHSPSAGCCVAAAFLREFVPVKHWAHIDIAGVMNVKDEISYLGPGMTGRPVRTLVEFAQLLATTPDNLF